MSRLSAALAAGRQGRISCFGDSTTAGFSTVPPLTRSWADSWPHRLAQRLAVKYGDGGTGMVYFDEPDSRVVFSGAWADEPYGPFAQSCKRAGTSTTPTLTFTPGKPVATFRVMHLTASGAGVINAAVDGQTVTTIDIASATLEVRVTEVPAPMSGPHTLTLRPNSTSGWIFIIAVEASTETGVAVTNTGRGSSVAANLINGGATLDTSMVCAFDANPPDLSVIAYGVNNVGNTTPAVMVADLSVLVDRAQRTGDAMLCTTVQWRAPATDQAPYDAAIRQLAADRGLALYDVAARWGSHAAASRFYSDDIHPNPQGYLDYARGLRDLLTSLGV